MGKICVRTSKCIRTCKHTQTHQTCFTSKHCSFGNKFLALVFTPQFLLLPLNGKLCSLCSLSFLYSVETGQSLTAQRLFSPHRLICLRSLFHFVYLFGKSSRVWTCWRRCVVGDGLWSFSCPVRTNLLGSPAVWRSGCKLSSYGSSAMPVFFPP